jgi:putative ABC transport system substrate-binding protein
LIAGATVAVVPDNAPAQQRTTPWRIGVLTGGKWPEETVQEFRQALEEAGYSEGRNVVIEWRPASGHFDRLPQLAAELVQSKVDVIVVDSTLATRALKRATSSIPIVMAFVSDPVGSGLVPSLAHPGGNVTGLSMMTTELSVKRLQLLKEALPPITRVAVLWNPDTPAHSKVVQLLTAAAPSLSIQIKFFAVRAPEELTAAFSAIRRAHAQALDVLEDPMFTTHRNTIFKLASDARLPAIYWDKLFARGGLMSYGTWQGDFLRGAVGYVDKILKGANPGDLPIEQPTKFELVVNLKTAKALGITIPEAILLRADELIQ